MEIAGSAALVTGAASGLGAATAAALAARGATVYGLDLEKSLAGTSVPDGVTLLAADVTEETGVRAALARIDDDGQQLRLAVNCAGIAPAARILSRARPARPRPVPHGRRGQPRGDVQRAAAGRGRR